MAWSGAALKGMAGRGLAWRGMVWLGAAWLGGARQGNKTELSNMKCKTCGYEWTSIKKNPKACPYCKRYIKREL